MQSRDFCYWLQGALEVKGDDGKGLTEDELIMVKNHLNMVFVHDLDPKAVQEKLQEAHDCKKNPSLIKRC